ncbi:PEP-utilizing enzyme [Rhodococcus opacus]|uniref:PEP-utilizing enzyme n=1 Tax=Rhodococcus opacus TaxID=37919 RepID=UPI00030F093F|nr:PEP-utilizing enzyme [Rhodococcus opacus]
MYTNVTDPIRGTSEPDRYWTSTNLGEACPEVMSPMCWSVWEQSAELGWLYSMYAFGVLPKRKVVVSPDVNDRGLSCFFGRQALNVDAIKEIMSALPGIDADDFERDLMGSVRPDAPRFEATYARVPVLMFKAPYALLRTGSRLRSLHDEMYDYWTSAVFSRTVSKCEPIEDLVKARERFQRIFSVHCVQRFMFQGAQSAVAQAAAKAGDAALADQLLSGVGDVNETKMADDLWRLGQGELTETEFLSKWGYHGPNEGNPYTSVWRENPGPVRALAASYAQRAERPAERAARAQASGAEAERRLLAATPSARRPVTRWLLHRMRNIIRTLQIGKAAYLMAIDAARAAARTFGAQQVERGVLDQIDDVFFFTIEECEELAAGRLPNPREIVDVRRATRADYKAMVLPVAFRGMPEPLEVDDRIDGATPTELSGAASGGGTVEGRARVVVDPDQEVELDAGDVLVCRFTDPSWAPLMALADALVIDIGGSASHGAVVARELGIPFVIGTENGTRVIRDGDRIRVDGPANLVSVLATAHRPEATPA